MAFVEDQQTNFKHFCRICKKGFMCGRALGGHMRAHGIGDEVTNMDEEDPGSDWEDRGNGKHIYGLRTNPNRSKSCRACKNCGKEFESWKSFLEHGKCNSDDAESRQSSLPSSDGSDEERRCQWSKRKRSLRSTVDSNLTCNASEENLAATCLVMLSNARVDIDEAQESCASAIKEDVPPMSMSRVSYMEKDKGIANKGLFECKACKKVFNSHQALGGHRASHKKVKGCFAARLDLTGEDEVMMNDDFLLMPRSTSSSFHVGGTSRRKTKLHECTICHRTFSSGQALGGHKRCHWLTSNSAETSSFAKFSQYQDPTDQIQFQRPNFSKPDTLDLNFPAPPNNLTGIPRDPKNPLSFEVPTEIDLQAWPDANITTTNNNHIEDNKNIEKINIDKGTINKDENVNKEDNILMQDVEDEADSKMKLAKLSELKDMNVSNGSSSWLQVGIGTTTNVDSDP